MHLNLRGFKSPTVRHSRLVLLTFSTMGKPSGAFKGSQGRKDSTQLVKLGDVTPSQRVFQNYTLNK